MDGAMATLHTSTMAFRIHSAPAQRSPLGQSADELVAIAAATSLSLSTNFRVHLPVPFAA